MAEIDRSAPTTIFEAIIEGDPSYEGSPEEIFKAWEDLFTLVDDLAQESGIPAEKADLLIKYSPLHNPREKYELRLNPAIVTAQGEAKVIVIDALRLGTTIQQFTGEAEWIDGKPRTTAVGEPYSPGSDEPLLTRLAVARYITTIINTSRNPILAPTHGQGARTNVPKNYVKGIQ